jgi:hypothetical protein
MLPLASSQGYAIIGGVVSATALLLWILLRSEARNEALARRREDQTGPDE